MLSRTWKVGVTFPLKAIGSTPMAGSQSNIPHLINLMCQGHLRYCMNQMKIDYNRTFEDQHPPVITNIAHEANPTLFCSNSVKIQKEYPPLDTTEWGQPIKALISDIIRNRCRNMFRKEKERCDRDSTRKRGRPAKPLSQ